MGTRKDAAMKKHGLWNVGSMDCCALEELGKDASMCNGGNATDLRVGGCISRAEKTEKELDNGNVGKMALC